MIDGREREKELIRGAIRGESSAFGLLYDEHQPRIYRFVLVKVGRREEAEDLTHQIFVNAWQNIRKYRDLGFPFSSWLYRIARNQVVDYYRSSKRDVELDEGMSEHLVETISLKAKAEERMLYEQAVAALQKLKAEYQDVIIMRFIEELSVKETALAMKKSEGAVKVLQHRALRELRTLLTPNDTAELPQKKK